MKLIRVGAIGSEKPGVLISDLHYVDVSDLVVDFNEAFFENANLHDLQSEVERRMSSGGSVELGSQRLGAPIARPHQIICIGLNYADHAAETNTEIPSEPIIFTKSPNTIIGPNDDVRIPRHSVKTDWEVELGVVVGKRARYLESEDSAMEHIAGYMLVNDISEREFQLERQGQWSKGKSSETFNPAGPFLVTRDEMLDSSNLSMKLWVNGELKQNSSTAQMVYGPAFLVHYLSQFLVLEPGDLINTGTPPGVGLGQKPPVYLKRGDSMRLEIQGLGSAKQRVINFDD
jgi:2,4-diketo-3-deoxy-L-fuconate hydrolase|tara:strand:- start:485 stop:1348 length:864 start_codon:yes stop_codon:yes gene_type:complete